MKPIALQLYTLRVRGNEDFVAVLKDVAEIGYKGVEFAGLHGHDPKEIRKIVDDLGMVCCSGHVGLPTAETVNEVIDTAKTLGYDTVISGLAPEDFADADKIRAAGETFQAAAELLDPHGLKMAYHNHWWEMGLVDGRVALELFFEAAPDMVSELDVYWACNFGAVDVAGLLTRIAPRVPLLHLKDGPLVKGDPHTAVGAGKMDIPAIVAAADASVHRWNIVELDDCATDMTQAVRDSYGYLTGEGLAEGNK